MDFSSGGFTDSHLENIQGEMFAPGAVFPPREIHWQGWI